MLGSKDEQHLIFALSEGRVLVTQDADFLRLHAAGHPHAGIVYAPQGTRIGTMIRGLMLIHDAMNPADMKSRVEFL